MEILAPLVSIIVHYVLHQHVAPAQTDISCRVVFALLFVALIAQLVLRPVHVKHVPMDIS